MTSTLNVLPNDKWLLPILREILPSTSLGAIESKVGDSYWRAAVDEGLTTDDEILEALSVRARVGIANGLLVSSQARDKVTEWLARRFEILPLSVSDSILDIATSNPYDIDCEKTLAFATGRTVRMSLAPRDRILERIEEVYAPVERVSTILDRAEKSNLQSVIEKADATEGEIDEKDAERPVIKLVDHIVAEGIATGASDIHLEAGESGIAVRYRIDGMLKEVMVLPKAVGVPLVSRIKIMSQMDIADRLRPQGGRARVAINGARVDLRVSTLPASHGEKVVIRILDSRAALRSVESLGLDPVDGPRMQKLLDVREGLILVTGPTGSGKTTTLYAALRLLQHRGVNIITVEDPVEYRIPGIVQVQIHEKAGLTFASALQISSPPGSGRRSDRRDSRPRDRGDRHTGIADRPPRVRHPAHQRRMQLDRSTHRPRRRSREARGRAQGSRSAALDSPPVPGLPASRQRRSSATTGRRDSRRLDDLRIDGLQGVLDDRLFRARRCNRGAGHDSGDRAGDRRR